MQYQASLVPRPLGGSWNQTNTNILLYYLCHNLGMTTWTLKGDCIITLKGRWTWIINIQLRLQKSGDTHTHQWLRPNSRDILTHWGVASDTSGTRLCAVPRWSGAPTKMQWWTETQSCLPAMKRKFLCNNSLVSKCICNHLFILLLWSFLHAANSLQLLYNKQYKLATTVP